MQAVVLEKQVAELVRRLRLPDDWRERLEELAGDQEDRAGREGKRQYLREKLRRLRELYLEGDLEKAEYNRRTSELQSQIIFLREPVQPEIEQAGETLESLGAEWASAPRGYQRDQLQVILGHSRGHTDREGDLCEVICPVCAALQSVWIGGKRRWVLLLRRKRRGWIRGLERCSG